MVRRTIQYPTGTILPSPDKTFLGPIVTAVNNNGWVRQRGRLLPPFLRLRNRHHKLLVVRWYFGQFPPQPTLVRERLESRGYMVDRLRELMLLGQFSPVQKIELSMVLDTISRIVMNM